MMTDDEQLLLQYARERSESAFGELVTRHIDFVYSTALRVVNGDSHLAQDVSQTVFIDLARKAGSLPGDVGLAGWLHHHTCYTAAKAVRGEQRRQSREQTAMEMRALDDDNRPEWELVAPYLDESLDQLNPADRDALVLRFLKQQDLRAVGEALGISDDAARKRVDRALEKLHVLLKHRGATLSAAALGTALTTEAVTAAPAGLAATVTAAAVSGSTITTTAVVAATKQIAMTTLQKTFIAATVAMLGAAGIYEARQAYDARAEVQSLRRQQASLDDQVRQTTRDRDDATNRLAAMTGEHERLSRSTQPRANKADSGRNQIALHRQEISKPSASPSEVGGADASRTKSLEAAMALSRQANRDLLVEGRLLQLKQRLQLTPEQQRLARELLGRRLEDPRRAGEFNLEFPATLTQEQQETWQKMQREDQQKKAEETAWSWAVLELGRMQSALGITREQQEKALPVLYQSGLEMGGAQDRKESDASNWPGRLQRDLAALKQVLTDEQFAIWQQYQQRMLKSNQMISEAGP